MDRSPAMKNLLPQFVGSIVDIDWTAMGIFFVELLKFQETYVNNDIRT